MCEGVAVVVSGGSRKSVMEEVVLVVIKEGGVTIVNEDGEELEVSGFKEVSVDLVGHKVTIVTE